jgi:NADPH2:quinone reductase
MADMESAHAVEIRAYGSPDVLVYQPVGLSPLGPGEVRIRTIAAAVNHTDLKIRSGAWPVRKPGPFPYVPGVEVVGTVSEIGTAVSGWAIGQPAISMMQGLGGVRAERPGGYADFVTVDADALAPVPASVDPLAMAALGLVAVTAFEGLRRAGPLRGKRVLVTGAAGGVGSAATVIARALGASVVGVVARTGQAQYVRALGAQDVVVAERGRPPALSPASVDAVLDSVGGPLFGPCVQALRDNGALVLVGAVGGGDVGFDAWHLIRPVTLTGYSSETLDGPALRVAIASLAGWLQARAIAVPEFTTMPLARAAHAHRLLEAGGLRGRVLLTPQASP